MSTQHTRRVIRIATIGVDERTRRTLDVVFKGPGEGSYALVEEGLAESVIFDFDCFNASVLWEDYRVRHPKLPTLVMSVNHKEVADTVFLRKPIQISSLFDALNAVKVKMDALQAATETQIDHLKEKCFDVAVDFDFSGSSFAPPSKVKTPFTTFPNRR